MNFVAIKQDLGGMQIELVVEIMQPIERVWQALVTETSRWWNAAFYTSPKTLGFHIEPRVGGRAYEDFGNDAGVLWYTVTIFDPLNMLGLVGNLTPDFGGPATTMVQITLTRTQTGGTSIKLVDASYGAIATPNPDQTREGWRVLLVDGLKKYVEDQGLEGE